MFVDAHCHLESMKNYTPSDKVLPVTVGYSHSSNRKNIEIARKFNLPFVLGIAPQTAIKEDISKLEEWVDLIRKNPPNAIGEIGLDYHWAKNEQDIKNEKIVFDRMLDLADEMNLPVVIHSRKSTTDVLDILEKRNFTKGIMLHFYSGTVEEAKRALSMGAYISIPTLHSKERRNVINITPLEGIVIETDSPYCTRSPDDVIKAAQYVAEVKNLDVEVVGEKTASNAKKFFNI